MRCFITGSRTPNDKLDRVKFEQELDSILEKYIVDGDAVSVLNGGQVGIDRSAQAYANKKRYDFFMYKPWHLIWKELPFSNSLFFYRNKQLIDNCDLVIILRERGEEDNYLDDIVRRCKNKKNPTPYCEVYYDAAG